MTDLQDITILNVDDDEGSRYAVSRILRHAGYTVQEAVTGGEALCLAAELPSLIILDVNLPDMSGVEVCQRLKTNPVTAAIPVLHLSATFTKSEDRIYGLTNGADGYLVQPVEPAELLATVQALLRLRRTEEALRRSEVMAQQLLQAAPDGVVVVDRDGRIVLVNTAVETMFGYTAEALRGKPVEILLPERFRPLYMAHRTAYMTLPQQRAMVLGLPLSGQRRDGSEFPVETGLSLVTTPDGPLIVGIIRDVTARRRLEEDLLAISDRERQRLGQELHDSLGQLLTGIAFMSKVLEQKLVAKSLPEAVSATQIAQQMHKALEQTRDLAHGLYPVELQTQGLVPALQSLAAHVESLYGITCRIVAKAVWHFPDPTTALHCYRIVQEAISNALKHGQAQQIVVRLTTSPSRLQLTVSDNGIGFPEGEQPSPGMGLRIMRYRAGVIGAVLTVQRRIRGGTRVTCTLLRPLGRDRRPEC